MAGSNATSRGVPRQILQGNAPMVQPIGASQMPTIQYSTGQAKLLQQFSKDMFQLSSEFEDRLDDQAAAEGASAGAIAGTSGDFQLQDYGTIRGRNFNKAALETFASTIDTGSIVKLNELQNQYWDNPDGLKQAWSDYTRGKAEVLRERDPAQAAIFENRSAVRGLPAIEQAKDTSYKLTRSQADAALIENEAALRVEVKNVSKDLFSENPERSRAAAAALNSVREDYMRIYSAKDPNTGKPLYSPAEIAKARVDFQDTTMREATLTWFDEQPNKADAYMKWAAGDFKINFKASNDQVRFINAANGTRKLPLGQDWYDKTAAAAAATGDGISVKIVSAGQHPKGSGGPRTGSTRHDVDHTGHGHTADIVLQVNGKDVLPDQNPKLYEDFLRNAGAAGFTGAGHYKWGIHIGGGSESFWGPDTGGASANPAFRDAFMQGRKGEPLETKPFNKELPIGSALSPATFNAVDAEMRQRLTFMNTQRERQEKAQDEVVKKVQAQNNFDMWTRIYGNGLTDPSTNQPIKPLSREEVMEATRLGTLTPKDGEELLKGLVTEHPQRSDDATYRQIMDAIYNGEDVSGMIRAAGSKLSRSDAMELYGKNKSVVIDKNGSFDPNQKFAFDQLGERLRRGAGPLASIDEGSSQRRAMALDEYRRRVLDPNNDMTPEAIANEIAERALSMNIGLAQDKLASRIPPRFSVMGGNQRIDLQKSALNIKNARDTNLIDDNEFRRLQGELLEWKQMMEEADQQAARRKK